MALAEGIGNRIPESFEGGAGAVDMAVAVAAFVAVDVAVDVVVDDDPPADLLESDADECFEDEGRTCASAEDDDETGVVPVTRWPMPATQDRLSFREGAMMCTSTSPSSTMVKLLAIT
jgi:hypothetical protein